MFDYREGGREEERGEGRGGEGQGEREERERDQWEKNVDWLPPKHTQTQDGTTTFWCTRQFQTTDPPSQGFSAFACKFRKVGILI